MNKLIQKFWYHLIFVLVIPAFFAGFSALYDTFGIREELCYGGRTFDFHLVMLYCIAIVFLLITRSILYFLNRRAKSFLWLHHLLWCVGEIFLLVYIFAMYTSLFSHKPYFECVLMNMGYICLSFIYPYSYLIIGQIFDEMKNAGKREEVAESRLLRFYDDRHKLRLSLESDSVLKVKADYNYIEVYYLERGEVKSGSIRSSMKSIEEDAASKGLVRCHRSYFINPAHVRILSRDRDGAIKATLDRDDIEPVPVSKKYYASLSEML